VPEAPAATVSQESLATAVQEQLLSAVTWTLPASLANENDALVASKL
jgi:hypothetical protein